MGPLARTRLASLAARAALAMPLALAPAACGGDPPLSLVVIAPPDGGDPFVGDGAATHARITIEDDASAPRTVPVGPRGEFTVDLRPALAASRARVVVEALRGGDVVATGATPPTIWQGLAGHRFAVLMHRRDALIPAPVPRFATPRASLRLLPLGFLGIAAVTVAPGETAARAPDVYDLLAHGRTPLEQLVPAEFDGDTAVVPVRRAWLLQRGRAAGLYTGVASQDLQRDVDVPAARQELVAPAVVIDASDNGAWLVGGRASDGAGSARVDRVTADARFESAPSLRHGRARPDVVELRPATGTAAPTWLLAGGQGPDAPLLEVYAPSGADAGASLPAGDAAIDRRVDAALVCVAPRADGCAFALVLGGRDGAGEPARDDVLLDARCALRRGDGCALVRARGAWLSRRRWGLRAALAEGGRVLVAGGRDASGPAGEVETVVVTADGADSVTVSAGRVIATLPYADPAVASLANGSVIVAGGTNPDGTASADVWFYRH